MRTDGASSTNTKMKAWKGGRNGIARPRGGGFRYVVGLGYVIKVDVCVLYRSRFGDWGLGYTYTDSEQRKGMNQEEYYHASQML